MTRWWDCWRTKQVPLSLGGRRLPGCFKERSLGFFFLQWWTIPHLLIALPNCGICLGMRHPVVSQVHTVVNLPYTAMTPEPAIVMNALASSFRFDRRQHCHCFYASYFSQIGDRFTVSSSSSSLCVISDLSHIEAFRVRDRVLGRLEAERTLAESIPSIPIGQPKSFSKPDLFHL